MQRELNLIGADTLATGLVSQRNLPLNTTKNNADLIKPDLKEAKKHLELLDGDSTSFTFQTYDDNSNRKDPELSCVLHGTLEEHYQKLVEYNKQGAAISVVVNETDGKGRKKQNIISIRAIWQEADNGDEPKLPCSPHIEIESSPGKYHRYIRTTGPEPNELDEFERVQQRLVEGFGSDPGAKDRPRVLRLAGFYHQKVNDLKCLIGSPHMVRITSHSDEAPYSWNQVKKLFSLAQNDSGGSLSIKHSQPKLKNSSRPQLGTRARILGALEYLNPDMAYSDWLQIGMAIHKAYSCDIGLDIWRDWSSKGDKFRKGECESKWMTFS